ncbi:uncharacterized protein METZ01_LOCUS34293 [marine metagenome]|uniref:Uncharacterized protein n=1 Tax=marine metagenome TaxID=408172 RepID=A0A381QSB2_9ZZZZ
MNKIGKDCEQIIWDYHFSAINYEKKIKEILFWNDEEKIYNNLKDKIQIYFLDFIDLYKKNKKKINKKIYFKFDLLHPNNEIIKELDIVLCNKEKYNYPIKEIIKLKDSPIFYILL